MQREKMKMKSHVELVLLVLLGLLGKGINNFGLANGEISSYSKLQSNYMPNQYSNPKSHQQPSYYRNSNSNDNQILKPSQHHHSNGASSSSYGREQGSWAEFQAAHVLNPDENADYMSWSGRDWRRWLMREGTPEIPRGRGRGQKDPAQKDYPLLRLRHTEPVVIGRPDEVLTSFNGRLLQYGTKNQALVWSSSPFQTFIFQKAGRRLRVFNCGQMYIAARLLNGFPVYLHDFYPSPIRNPLGGHLRYPISRYCKRLHAF